MRVVYMFLALLIGSGVNIQSGVNGQLGAVTLNPIFATIINFCVGMTFLLILLFVTCKTRTYKLPDRQVIKETKWWMWIGGPLGIAGVMTGVVIPAYIGFGAYFSMLVTGQLVFSAVIDHFGWLGNEVVKMDLKRSLGIILLIAGAIIVQNT